MKNALQPMLIFITFVSKLETYQTYDEASFLEKEEFQIVENNDYYDNSETSDESKIKHFKTAISYS